MKLTNYVLILLFLPAGNALSGHLIGGDFSYKCLGDNKYEINLTIYRNCECNGEPNCADFDSQAKVTIYNGEMEFVDTLLMNLNVEIEREEIKPQTYELCLREAPDVCVERSTGYSEIITLPPSITGYSLSYMRCCRNRSINNLVNPSKQGNTYLLEIPPSDVAACNSSPVFKNLPPIILCAGYQFSFNHSATDIDGDRLEYSLCEPYDYPLNPDQPSQGGNGPIIQSGQLGPPPPYDAIVWTDSFSASNQIGGNPEMTIDRNTGVLTAFPDNIGRYVIGICVSEYRNGILLSTTIRDYQLKIVDCDVVEAEVESTSIDANGNFILKNCEDFASQFKNITEGTESFFWDFGDNTADGTDISTLRNPVYEYPDTGRYEVTLIANPNQLCADTATIFLDLYPELIVDFDWEPSCAGTNMKFTNTSTTDVGTITENSWSFGDGNSAATQNPDNIFDIGGDYQVLLTVTNDVGCTQEIVKQVYVKPNPSTDFGNTPICIEQQPVNFSDLSEINIGNIVSRTWQISDETGSFLFESNEPNIEYNFVNPGNYNVLLTAISNEGCIETKSASITLLDKLEVEAGENKDVCSGSSVQVNASINEPATFEWESDVFALFDDDTSKITTITPFENTIVIVTATDQNGCQGKDSLQITQRKLPNVDAGPNQTICPGEFYNLEAGVTLPQGGTGQISYQWSPDSFINNTTTSNPVINPQNDIIYYLAVTESEFNCVNNDSVIITIEKPITATVNDELTICELEPVQLFADGGAFYNWQPPMGLSNPSINNPVATISETTTFTVEVSNYCFTAETSVTVNVQPAPDVEAGDDVVLDIGDVIQLNATVENIAETIVWLPNTDILNGENTVNLELQPLKSRDYIITATSNFGCSLSDTISVTVNNIFNFQIPNAFSPNNDGTNDFIGITPKGIKEFDVFKIFNRWGQKVFETNNINENWDGTFKGKPNQPGVYVYYAAGITYLDEYFIEKGNITLIR